MWNIADPLQCIKKLNELDDINTLKLSMKLTAFLKEVVLSDSILVKMERDSAALY